MECRADGKRRGRAAAADSFIGSRRTRAQQLAQGTAAPVVGGGFD